MQWLLYEHTVIYWFLVKENLYGTRVYVPLSYQYMHVMCHAYSLDTHFLSLSSTFFFVNDLTFPLSLKNFFFPDTIVFSVIVTTSWHLPFLFFTFLCLLPCFFYFLLCPLCFPVHFSYPPTPSFVLSHPPLPNCYLLFLHYVSILSSFPHPILSLPPSLPTVGRWHVVRVLVWTGTPLGAALLPGPNSPAPVVMWTSSHPPPWVPFLPRSPPCTPIRKMDKSPLSGWRGAQQGQTGTPKLKQ